MGLKIRRVKNGFSYYAEYKLGKRGVVYEKIEAQTKKQAEKIYKARLQELRDDHREPPPPRIIPPKLARLNGKMTGTRSILASNVVRLRKAARMSQEELAISAGIDRTYVSQIEKAKRNVSLDVIDALAQSLRTTTPQLLSSKSR